MRRIWTMLITAAVLANCMTLTAYASGILGNSTAPARNKIISVVFDDSGSMIYEGYYSTRWVDADYALKAMASMMEDGDTLRLYLMGYYREENSGSRPKEFHINGDRDDTISEIETVMKEMEIQDNTYSRALDAAKSDFSATELQSKDCWLVILTDGKFNAPELLDSADKLKPKLNSLAQVNTGTLQIAYIPMGNGAVQLTSDPANHLTVPDGEEQVTKQVTEVINKIYQRVRMDDSVSRNYLIIENDHVIVKPNVPMENVVVFLQYQGAEELFSDFQGRSEEDIQIRPQNTQPSATSHFTGNDPSSFSSRQTLPNGKLDHPESVRYHVLQGEIFTWQGNTDTSLENFLNQEIKIPVENGRNIQAEVYYQPAVTVGFDFMQDGALVEHVQDCNFAGLAMDAEEACLQAGSLQIRLKMLDSQGKELQEPTSPFLYPNKFSVTLSPQDRGTPIEFQRTAYQFAGMVEQKKYTMEIQTPWNETLTQMLDVQEKHKPLKIEPVSSQIVVDDAGEEKRSVKIMLLEAGKIISAENQAYVTVTGTSLDDSLIAGDVLVQEDGCYSFPVSLADPSQHQISEKALFHIRAVRRYSNGTAVETEEDVEVVLSSGPHTLEVRCTFDEPIRAADLLFFPQKIDVEYYCDGEKLTEQQERELIVTPLSDNSVLDGLTRIARDKNLEIKPSFSKWWNMPEQELTVKLRTEYTKYNSQSEAECTVPLSITPVPPVIKTVCTVLAYIVCLWFLACVIKLFTPWHIKKQHFYLASRSGGITYDLMLKRKRNILIPWHTKAVLKLGEEAPLDAVSIMPALRLIIKNGERGQSFYLCNWLEFEKNDAYHINGLRITKQNSTFSSNQRFSLVDGLQAVEELYIEEH